MHLTYEWLFYGGAYNSAWIYRFGKSVIVSKDLVFPIGGLPPVP